MLFLAIQKMNDEGGNQSNKPHICSDYLKKIHYFNHNLANDISELNISPQTSHTYCFKEYSENDTILDKTNSKLEEHSFLNSKIDISEVSRESR